MRLSQTHWLSSLGKDSHRTGLLEFRTLPSALDARRLLLSPLLFFFLWLSWTNGKVEVLLLNKTFLCNNLAPGFLCVTALSLSFCRSTIGVIFGQFPGISSLPKRLSDPFSCSSSSSKVRAIWSLASQLSPRKVTPLLEELWRRANCLAVIIALTLSSRKSVAPWSLPASWVKTAELLSLAEGGMEWMYRLVMWGFTPTPSSNTLLALSPPAPASSSASLSDTC